MKRPNRFIEWVLWIFAVFLKRTTAVIASGDKNGFDAATCGTGEQYRLVCYVSADPGLLENDQGFIYGCL